MRASVRTVSQWRNTWRQGGDVGLAHKPALGRPRKLIDAQRHQLLNSVVVRCQSQRFPQRAVDFETHCRRDSGPVWGTLSPAHIWRFLRSLGWSCQASERRPIQRDEQAIAQWKRYQWPAINKSACLGAHLTFLDESGFLLMPIRPNTGLLPGTRLSSPITTSMTGYPLWRPSRCLPSASLWACTSGFTRRTSRLWTWRTTCGFACATCGAVSCASGSAAPFTRDL